MATTITTKGKIGVLIEDHFDQTEYRLFNEFFPQQGYEVVYISHLWGEESLKFGGNPDDGDYNVVKVTVTTEISQVNPADYRGFICIGAYAMDRLRYQTNVRQGQKNQAPAVVFLRENLGHPKLKWGTICHSLWLFCADPDLIRGRRVTCAHNIICDVENAGGIVVYEASGTAEVVIDGNLISAKHPTVTEKFMAAFIQELEKSR